MERLKLSARDLRPGAFLAADGNCTFRVWAPDHDRVRLRLLSPVRRDHQMDGIGRGYHEATVGKVAAGQRYVYELAGHGATPDPASRSQPDGVHGPSEVVSFDAVPTDPGWQNHDLRDYVFYELHVGTFTREGTFEAAIPHLTELADLGINAVELMPIGEFPGARNWGYDGVYPYAAESAYGGPAGLAKFVEACHSTGLAVVLDVVYNHVGPEGNYLDRYGPYFTDAYRTPWGRAINFDGPGSDEVRRFFIENALYWTMQMGVDALRLDAIHAIVDPTASPFLAELTDEVHAVAERAGRAVHLVAESALNDPRVCWPSRDGGLGMDAHWNDDFHHALRVTLTGERAGYYKDFEGLVDLRTALAEGYVFAGRFSSFRGRRHGRLPARLAPEQLVVYSRNHDQVGNRAEGDRPTALMDIESLKLAAGVTLLSPFTPLLFMGEEYAEKAPFPYFVSHTDPELITAVRKGRSGEFRETVGSSKGTMDPQAAATFESAKLDHSLKSSGVHQAMYSFYKELLALRRREPMFRRWPWSRMEVLDYAGNSGVLLGEHRHRARAIVCVFNFGDENQDFALGPEHLDASVLIDSSDQAWGGPRRPNRKPDGSAAAGSLVELLPKSFIVLSAGLESDL